MFVPEPPLKKIPGKMNISSIVLTAKVSLWSLTLLGPHGEYPVYDTSTTVDSTVTVEGNRTTREWTYIAGGERKTVTATVETSCTGEQRWSFSCTVPKGWTVTDLVFPRIAIPRPDGAKIITSAGYGAQYDLPSDGGAIESRYPSVTGCMQTVMVHDRKSTWYYAAYDTSACTKTFSVRGGQQQVTFVQQIPASYAWTSPDGDFTLPWSTVFCREDDTWENTVLKHYRPFTFTVRWGGKLLRERYIVPWIKDADIWIRPKNMFPQVVGALEKAVDYYGAGTGVHWYHWHRIPYDTNYPEYFPAREGFIGEVGRIQGKGAHVTPYTNGRLWDPATRSYKEKGHLASCRRRDGTLYTEIYPTSNIINTVTCPGSDIWQETLKGFAVRAIEELGTDGLYIDQIGAAASEPCYAPNHNHAPGGGGWWPEAYRRIICGLREGAFGKEYAITTEENGECYLDLFDMMLIVNTPHGYGVEMVPLFPLIYSDRCIYSGLNYYHEQLNDGHFLYNNARSLLWGAQLGWIQPEWLMKEENGTEIRFLKTLGTFRKANHDIFLGGRFLGEVPLGGDIPTATVMNGETFPEVMASRWLSLDGDDAVIVVNWGGSACTVTLPDGRTVTIDACTALRI